MADSARPGLYDLLGLLDARDRTRTHPKWIARCPFHNDRDTPNLIIEYKPSRDYDLAATGNRLLIGCSICQGEPVVPPKEGSLPGAPWRKVNASTVTEAVGLDESVPYRNHHQLANLARAGSAPAAPPDAETVALWHAALTMFSDLPEALYARGLSPETVARYRIGWCQARGRYSIPVWDSAGEVVACRYWGPGQEPRYIGHAGCKVTIYPRPPRPQRRPLVICEGEFDCLLLRQHGFLAVTTTGGKGAWNEDWSRFLARRNVVFLYDVGVLDDAARHARKLDGIAASVRVVDLGLPNEGDDVTDWFTTYGRTSGRLGRLIRSTPVAGGA